MIISIYKYCMLFPIYLMLCNCAVGEQNKWRYPREEDYSGDWAEYRKTIPKPFYASGDFNGDGKKDEAWIKISKDGLAWGLFVSLSGTIEDIMLDKTAVAKIKPQSMGIDVLSPEDFKEECKVRDDPECKTLGLKYDALDYFAYESASSFFYWDNKNKIFKQVWRGD